MTKIYRKLAKKYNINLNEMQTICNSPFHFIFDRMQNDDDKDILLHYLVRFKKKTKFKKL